MIGPMTPAESRVGVGATSYAGAAGGVLSGMQLLTGLFGFLSGGQYAGIAESRARMLRDEADAEAELYAERARGFRAQQKLAYLKAGVALTGSPLDVMDRDILTARENISAIRARGRAGALDSQFQAGEARGRGRAALLQGITGAASTLLLTRGAVRRNSALGEVRND